MKKIYLRFSILLSTLSGFSQQSTEINLKTHFDEYGVEGCFVLYDPMTETYLRYNPDRCDSGFIPASTFKIPHSLIALEEKIIRDTNQVIPWNGHDWPHKVWNRDQTLKTAMKYSCVWVYVGFAEQLSIDIYYDYVETFNYGNKDLTGPPTRFWLNGSLRISANQQIQFLKKFYQYDLPVSKESIDLVKSIIILDQSETYTMSGKTGGGVLPGSQYIMWLVGYLEKGNKPYFYAMNFITDDYDKKSQARYDITKSVLRELNLIE